MRVPFWFRKIIIVYNKLVLIIFLCCCFFYSNSEFMKFVDKAALKNEFEDNMEKTLFAPSNEAFKMIPQEKLNDLIYNNEIKRKEVKKRFHVSSGPALVRNFQYYTHIFGYSSWSTCTWFKIRSPRTTSSRTLKMPISHRWTETGRCILTSMVKKETEVSFACILFIVLKYWKNYCPILCAE